jgi:hypothetical protein
VSCQVCNYITDHDPECWVGISEIKEQFEDLTELLGLARDRAEEAERKLAIISRICDDGEMVEFASNSGRKYSVKMVAVVAIRDVFDGRTTG